MQNLNWDDVRVFLRVAEGGGLTPAAATTGLSAATIGRRITALEQCIGRTLFERSQSGYRLTADGRSLMDKALAMDASMQPIAEWALTSGAKPGIRVSAGTWTANFLAENIHSLWQPDDDFQLCFKTTEARLDIAHREAEIGLRNAMPETGNLAGRKLSDVAFAPYRARNLASDKALDWVAVGRDEALTASARWVLDQPDVSVVVWANTFRMLHDLIRAGVGIGVLPCFAGDRDAGLLRAGDVIAEMDQAQYIVAHADDRHRPEVRTVIRRITSLVEGSGPLFRGELPQVLADI